MRTAKKYKISHDIQEPVFKFEIPEGSIIKKLILDLSNCTIFVECYKDEPLVTRTFKKIRTGEEIPKNCEYLSTVEPAMTYHIFEVK